MRIYIAGRISGDPQYRKKFAQAERQLKKRGNTVINPASLPKGMSRGDYMRICLAMLDTAEAVVFLPDWHESFGAKLEMAWCEYTGKRIEYLTEVRV